jgi:PAS domain S-box-containing protein
MRNERQNTGLTHERCDNAEFTVPLDCLCIHSMPAITHTGITKIEQAKTAFGKAEPIALITTERMQMEKAREDELIRLQKITSQLPGMVFQFRLRADGSACFPFVSEAIRELYRLSPEDVREDASKLFALLHPDDYDGFNASIQQSAQNLSTWSYEYRVKFDDGTVRWLLGNARLQREADGATLWHGFITDITERNHLERQDKEHLDELAHITRLGLMGEMISGIAHEVNQPLAAISGYTHVSLNLINTENPDLVKLTETLSKTQQQALRAGGIIHRMREFIKSHTKQCSTVDINKLIHAAVDLCIADLKHNDIQLTFELTKNLPPVYVDQIQIEQVLINLIRNSIAALQNIPAKQQPQLTIHSYLASNNEIQVSVEDNGTGIDEDQQQKILMPFYTTKTDDIGMGLSISRSLIEAHKGTFHFSSEPGKGSTFYFTLPIEIESEER